MSASGPVHVVFVHGFHSSGATWDTFESLLTEDPDLAGLVVTKRFQYDSPLVRIRPDRRIPKFDDVADQLGTFLSHELQDAESIVLVSHSQGGLVVQRFLARRSRDGRAKELTRIKHILMYSCPNPGSQFMLSVRQRAPWRNQQETELRPLDRLVTEAQRTVLEKIVNADETSETQCPIPITACAGTTDKIVPPSSAVWVFPSREVVDGDHFSVVEPSDRNASSFLVAKKVLMHVAGQAMPSAKDPADSPPERLTSISLVPPFGRRDGPLQGRDGQLRSIMANDAASRVHLLIGLPGSGKSRLAVEVAHAARARGKRVWWVEVTRLNSCLRELANRLGASETQIEMAWRGEGSPPDLVWRLLEDFPEEWVLIFDNADDPRLLDPSDRPVSDGTGWLRPVDTENGMVVVTSRDRNQAAWGDWHVQHLVEPLDDAEGAAMLMHRTGGIGGTREEARQLSAALGGLPLALRAAADYVKAVGGSKVWPGETNIRDFAGYLAAVKQRFESPPGVGDLSESMGLEIVEHGFRLSLELLADRGLPEAAPLLKLFACLNIAPIPYAVLMQDHVIAENSLFAHFTAGRQRAAVDGLGDLGLIELDIQEGVGDRRLSYVLSLHPVVHGILRADRDVRQRRADYYGLTLRMLLAATETYDPDLPENWTLWSAVAPHAIETVRATLGAIPRLDDQSVLVAALQLARTTSRYLIMAGLLKPVEEFLPPIIDECATFGFHTDDREILALRHERGRMALERGDPEAAERELRQVISARERVIGSDDPDTWASRHKLAKAILEQGRWGEAEKLLRSIVIAEHDIRGPEHSDTMVVRHSLARAVLAQGRPDEAELMLRDILGIRYRRWSLKAPETLIARQTLARSLSEQGKWADAESEVRDALTETADRMDSPASMFLRFTLTSALLGQGRTEEALGVASSLLADRERVLGTDHPETERTNVLLERIRDALGRSVPDDPESAI